MSVLKPLQISEAYTLINGSCKENPLLGNNLLIVLNFLISA